MNTYSDAVSCEVCKKCPKGEPDAGYIHTCSLTHNYFFLLFSTGFCVSYGLKTCKTKCMESYFFFCLAKHISSS